jgi:TonB-dependent receptor
MRQRMRILSFIIFSAFIYINCPGADISGTIKDHQTGELLVGATVYIKELNLGTISGLDGSYKIKNVPKGKYTLVCSFISYNPEAKEVNISDEYEKINADYILNSDVKEIGEVTVSAQRDKSSELSARMSERTSSNLLNVASAKTIELSPDQDVASVVQRMSGVTLDKSSSGSGQYALLRGMDKRYSYTLINGIKIPSTNDKHRYVSLDIFPSELEDRVEVSKVLTPDMEGDAIAGAINLVMKNAPERFLVQANASIGYNTIWGDVPFLTFDNHTINRKSPYELNGIEYHATPDDFPNTNLDLHTVNNPVNTTAGLTIGDRFFHRRMGWILAASFNDNYKGTNSLIYGEDQSTDGTNLPMLTSMQERFTYTHQTNYGIHNKLDFAISPNHNLQLYMAYMHFNLLEVRDQENTELGNNSYDPEHGGKNMTHSDRNRWNLQTLINITLQGEHEITRHISIQWSAVYSKADNQSPDNSTVSYDKTYINFVLQPQYVDFGGSGRLWLQNTDQDKAAYLNFKYTSRLFSGNLEIKAGGLYRDKDRTSFYNNYKLIPQGPVDNHSARGIDWENYSDINWSVSNPMGAVNTPGTFNAYENVSAGYLMFQYGIYKFQVISGVRYENSRQGYDEVFHNAFLDKFKPGNDQKRDHIDDYFLPSVNIQYALSRKSNLKASYYRAINKPGFLEIVPYLDNTGDYPKTGNPDLRNAVADNYDARLEYFPNQMDQALVGAFYKKIKDAIEEGFLKDGHGNYNLSTFNSDATNYGFEADVVKFYREFGIKANYTWTHSETSSYKRSQVNGVVNRDSTVSSLEYRPLFGQSENVFNVSLLYKGSRNGFSSQLALSYTGERIYKVSPDINADLWQKGFYQLDVSAEKKFKHGIGLFIKARNLLNSKVNVYIKQKNPYNEQFPGYSASDENTLIRDEYSKPSYLIGIRYKFN